MQQPDEFTAADAGRLLARGADPETAHRRFREWARVGIIPAQDRDLDARGKPFVYSRASVAICAVLFLICDSGVRDQRGLALLYRHFASPSRPGEPTLIDEVLADVACGGKPFLVATVWEHVSGSRQTIYATRLTDEAHDPPSAPGADWAPVMLGKIELAPLLLPFVQTATILPFKKKAAE